MSESASESYVAAYFATRGRTDVDGVIWAVDYSKVHDHLPEPFGQLLDEAGIRIFEADLLDDNLYRGLADEGVPIDILDQNGTTFEAPSVDDRIINQSALFSATTNPNTRLDHWLARNAPDAVIRVVIPAECKLEFRDRLAQANITAKSLFPGLDGITAWLCEYYRPRADGSLPAEARAVIDSTPALRAGEPLTT